MHSPLSVVDDIVYGMNDKNVHEKENATGIGFPYVSVHTSENNEGDDVGDDDGVSGFDSRSLGPDWCEMYSFVGYYNCKDIFIDTCFKAERKVVSGTTMFENEFAVNESGLPAKQMSAIVLHIDTGSLEPENDNIISSVYIEYVEGIRNIAHTYPDTDIVIWRVLPRFSCTNKLIS